MRRPWPHTILKHHWLRCLFFRIQTAPCDIKGRFPLTLNFHFIKLRYTRRVNIAARTNRVNPHGTHHIPSTHLSAILIANQSIRTVFIKCLTNPVHDGLRLLRLSTIVVQVSHVMTRFVAMGILTNQSRNIRLIAARSARISAKQRIQMIFRSLYTTQFIHHPHDIMRNIHRILPSIGLSKMVIHLPWIKRR